MELQNIHYIAKTVDSMLRSITTHDHDVIEIDQQQDEDYKFLLRNVRKLFGMVSGVRHGRNNNHGHNYGRGRYHHDGCNCGRH
ncbi:hypothetical protein PVAP13_7NG025500 [Panicum virgatum]|uniref:Uncharacterized protein n=1 Tax=Panicum virgatum TaxID=38727 RepID=A0A8T0PSZ9_PANVG|nr:hypothetical protein PVAP13_7NG025500 [Panicum virgatum]